MEDALETVMIQCELWTDNESMDDRVVSHVEQYVSSTQKSPEPEVPSKPSFCDDSPLELEGMIAPAIDFEIPAEPARESSDDPDDDDDEIIGHSRPTD